MGSPGEEWSPARAGLVGNWLRQRKNLIPILGARRVEQLLDNLACLEWTLDTTAFERLEAATAIDLGFPNTMIAHAADFVYGGTLDEIDGARERAPIRFAAPATQLKPA